MHLMTFALPPLHHYLRALWQQPAGPVRVPVGVRRSAERVERIAAAQGSEVGRVVLLSWSDTLAMPRTLPPECAGVVLLGPGERGASTQGSRLPMPQRPQRATQKGGVLCGSSWDC